MKWPSIVIGAGLILLSLIVWYQFTGTGPSVVEGPQPVIQRPSGMDRGAIQIPASEEVQEVEVELTQPEELQSDPVVEVIERGTGSSEEDSPAESVLAPKGEEQRTLSYFGRVEPEPRNLNLDLHLVSTSGEEIRVTPEGLFNKTYSSNDPLLGGTSAPPSIQESFSVWADSDEIEHSRSLTLWPAASLSVSVLGADTIDGGAEGLQIQCELDSGWVTMGWGWARVYQYRRDKRTDRQSAQHFEVRNLPPNARIWIIAKNRGDSGQWRSSAVLGETSVTLEPGEHREIVFDLTRGTRVLGSFVDEHGRPVPGHEVWISPVEFEFRAKFSEYDTPTFSTFTDDNGRFEFEAVESGEWLVGPSPRRAPWHSPDEELFAPIGKPIKLEPDTRVAEVEIVGYRELYIRGRLIDPAGAPIPKRVSINAIGQELGVKLWCESDNNGHFLLGPLIPGVYALHLRSIGAWRPPDEILAKAGDSNVDIQFLRAGSITGSVVYGTTGEKARADVHLTKEGAFEEGIHLYDVYFQTEGYFEFKGLASGTYYVSAASRDGRVGMSVVELNELAEVRDVVVQLEQSAAIKVFNEIEHEATSVRVWLGDAHAGNGVMSANDGDSITVLPGKLHVQISLSGIKYTETVVVKPGETKAVVFSKK